MVGDFTYGRTLALHRRPHRAGGFSMAELCATGAGPRTTARTASTTPSPNSSARRAGSLATGAWRSCSTGCGRGTRGVDWPAVSTAGDLLKHRGLVKPRRRRYHATHPGVIPPDDACA
jgi:hypothetical protein